MRLELGAFGIVWGQLPVGESCSKLSRSLPTMMPLGGPMLKTEPRILSTGRGGPTYF